MKGANTSAWPPEVLYTCLMNQCWQLQINIDGYAIDLMTQQCIEELWLMVDVHRYLSRDWDYDQQQIWWAKMMSNIDEQRFMSSSEQWYNRVDVMCREDEQLWCNRDFLCDTSILYCKSKLVLLLRLGYLKPFLAGSKKTRQGPRCRVGALCISRYWFCLMVVAEPKLI